MADWLFTLNIKSLWQDEPDDADFNKRAVKNATIVSARIRSLMAHTEVVKEKRVLDRIGDLYTELEEVADMFDDIAKLAEDVAQVAFNDALALLYDIADDGHRVWVK